MKQSGNQWFSIRISDKLSENNLNQNPKADKILSDQETQPSPEPAKPSPKKWKQKEVGRKLIPGS